MQPDCRDIKPVYEQITDGIRKMIITHAIPEGERMAASEKQIAELIRKEMLQEFDTVVIRLQNMSVGTEELTGRMWELAGGSKDFD